MARLRLNHCLQTNAGHKLELRRFKTSYLRNRCLKKCLKIRCALGILMTACDDNFPKHRLQDQSMCLCFPFLGGQFSRKIHQRPESCLSDDPSQKLHAVIFVKFELHGNMLETVLLATEEAIFTRLHTFVSPTKSLFCIFSVSPSRNLHLTLFSLEALHQEPASYTFHDTLPPTETSRIAVSCLQ